MSVDVLALRVGSLGQGCCIKKFIFDVKIEGQGGDLAISGTSDFQKEERANDKETKIKRYCVGVQVRVSWATHVTAVCLK